MTQFSAAINEGEHDKLHQGVNPSQTSIMFDTSTSGIHLDEAAKSSKFKSPFVKGFQQGMINGHGSTTRVSDTKLGQQKFSMVSDSLKKPLVIFILTFLQATTSEAKLLKDVQFF